MPARKRRKSDQEADASRPPRPSSTNDGGSLNAWLALCEVRIAQVEPSLTLAERQHLARSMLEFERTGAMPPEAAVDFVVSQMSKSERDLLERRSARR